MVVKLEKKSFCKFCHSKPLQRFSTDIQTLKSHQKTLGQASLAKSLAANTSRATTLETMKVPTPQGKKSETLMALQYVVCHASHRTIEIFLQT